MQKHWVVVHNQSHPLSTPIIAYNCGSFACRLRGLTFKRSLQLDEGLLLIQKRENKLDAAIHMLFVWFDITAVWINNAQQVVDVRLARRWCPVYIPKRSARYVLEVAASRIDDFRIGDQVHFEFSDYGSF